MPNLRWRQLIYAALLILIVVLSVLPGTMKIRTALPGPVTHVLAYAGAAMMLAIVFRSGPERLRILLTMTGFAFVLELVQWPLPGRDSSIVDFIVSSASAALGLLAIQLTERLRDVSRRS